MAASLEGEPIGTPLPTGGRPQTDEQRDQIFARREKSVELYAHGYSYTQIAKAMDVSWKTSYNDVQVYLEHAARYFNAPRTREQIANPIRTTIRKAEAIYQKFSDRIDPDAIDAKFRAIAAIQRGSEALARLYGMSGERSLFLTNVNVSPGEGLVTGSTEWAKDLSPEKVDELRAKVIDFYKARYEPAAVPAEFTIEEGGAVSASNAPPEVAPNPPKVENGHAPNGESDGPVSMRSG